MLSSYALALLYLVVLFYAMACSNEQQKPAVDSTEKKLLPPKTTLLSSLSGKDQPRQILLDTVPAPLITTLAVGNKAVSYSETSGKDRSLLVPAKGRGFFATYTSDDGLALDQVYCSYKDKWGNLWFGTNGGGVSKYDGKNFITYTTVHGLANNVVWCIIQDHDGNMWFGTDGNGASKYDGESFTNYTTVQGLAGDVVFSIAEDKNNNLWFGTLKDGVSKWDGKTFINYSAKDGLPGNAVKCIYQDSKQNLWFATLGGGASKWNGTNFINYTIKDGLVSDKVWSIAGDNSGNVWFGTDGKGLGKYDGTAITNFDVLDEASNDAIQYITKDAQGNLWLASQKKGLIKYDGNFFINYSTSNGVANNQIKSITEDLKGNLWLGTFGSGICKFAGNSVTNFTTVQGLPDNIVYSITEDDKGKLWLATSSGGVSSYDEKHFLNFTKANGLVRNEIYCVSKDSKGSFWFGTSGSGVVKFDGQRFINYTTAQGLANNIVFSILEDKNAAMWFATSGGGVSTFDGNSFTNYTTTQGLAGNVVFSIKQDKNANLWFGTLGGGVSKFDGKGFTNYTTEQGLADDVVWTVSEDKQNNLWFGTQHGLSLMPKRESTKESAEVLTSFTTDDGLPNNFITQVIQGDDDKLYVGTNLGLCELLPVKEKQSSKGWIAGRIFNTQQGYPVKDVNAGQNAMFKDSKGIIWIGTGSDKTGLVRFEPSALNNNKDVVPNVFINQIKINNEPIGWRSIEKRNVDSASLATEQTLTYGKKLSGVEKDSLHNKYSYIQFDSVSKWNSLPQNLVLPHYFNNVSFEFGAIETGKNFLVNYKYFLEGYDKEWSPASHNTYVNFGNINEGSYTFKVKAQSPDGSWSEPVSYSFKVLAPWWRTWWMFALYALLIIASIFLFIRWKHKRIIYKQKILEHKVAVATKQVREETEKVEVQKKKAEDALAELKATQAQLIQSEKMASLGELTAGIAHEIQNPLNFVNNFSEVSNELVDEMNAELAKGDIEEARVIASDLKQNLEKINNHGKRAGDIVKGMLQHSRTSSGQKELTDINTLCDEYLRLAYHGLKAKEKDFTADFKTEFDTALPKINVVPQDIGRVLLNLINNAFYAVNEKKKTSPTGYQPSVVVKTQMANNDLEIKVSDNGDGIPGAAKEKIFQPFFTTKPTGEGTGLGLSLAYDIVTKGHGGKLSAVSEEGEGTSFTISLPASN